MKQFFKALGKYFADFGTAVSKGDIWVKLSLIIMGIGYIGRGQIIKGILVTLLEAGFALFTANITWPYITKLNTLGTVQREEVFDPLTMTKTVNEYDNSLLILLFGVVGIAVILAFILIYIANIKAVYKTQQLKKNGKHINNFAEDLRDLINDKFHITLLTLPSIGVIFMCIMPIIFMVCIAFTNYDAAHQPPSVLFTWVGWKNFITLFSNRQGSTFAYAFGKVLVWTLIWAALATVTTYIGGILLAMLINHQDTKLKKMWRSLFVVTIAIPQFVTLLLISKMFGNYGIVNGILTRMGVISKLLEWGWINTSYVPFMTQSGLTHVMIILINIWVGIPYQMLIATGILMNIPSDQLESARIDGANKFQIFWKITMPYMLFITGPSLITSFIGNINNFNVIYLLTGDYVTTDASLAAANAKDVDLLITWLFKITSESQLKQYYMASVIGIVVFIICATLTLVTYSRMIKGDKEEVFQ
ncbi:MAG: ABC transporter permease subunit [Lachnospiraceae bacterium]|nr:ABC transporter permease subunit [Lachnospiraceae bacterium]